MKTTSHISLSFLFSFFFFEITSAWQIDLKIKNQKPKGKKKKKKHKHIQQSVYSGSFFFNFLCLKASFLLIHQNGPQTRNSLSLPQPHICMCIQIYPFPFTPSFISSIYDMGPCFLMETTHPSFLPSPFQPSSQISLFSISRSFCLVFNCQSSTVYRHVSSTKRSKV